LEPYRRYVEEPDSEASSSSHVGEKERCFSSRNGDGERERERPRDREEEDEGSGNFG
jgi:hypothetical protein